MRTLYDKLVSYSESDFYGFHMPGHKRNRNLVEANLPYNIDITEIEGFDDLHHAAGILKDAQKRAAKVYKAQETHFLVNGSTCGILSAIFGCTEKGDQILVARNCHKSVYHAMFLNELIPTYLYPEFCPELELNGEVKVEDVRHALEENSNIRAVMITSPTYDGVISDIHAIAAAVHAHGIPLIVDEAHGAHLGFHRYFPDNANVRGADLVIHSLHKTLPALTQTALLHMNGRIVDRKKVNCFLDIFQTSSPSYVLMASIDACIDLLENRGDEIFETYTKRLNKVREELSSLKCLRLLETKHFDRSKIIISVKGLDYTSKQLYEDLLETYHLQMEMTAGSYVLAMTTIGDTSEGMDRLVHALREIDTRLYDKQSGSVVDTKPHHKKQFEKATDLNKTSAQVQEVVYNSADMARLVSGSGKENDLNKKNGLNRKNSFSRGCGTKYVPFEECEGSISTEYAYIYPPGTPLLVPGERVSKETVELLKKYYDSGFHIEGLGREKEIEVWINE